MYNERLTYHCGPVVLERPQAVPVGRPAGYRSSASHIVLLNMTVNYCTLANETMSPLTRPWMLITRAIFSARFSLRQDSWTHARKIRLDLEIRSLLILM